jgi:DNA-binding NarL/FixJ family response regulator
MSRLRGPLNFRSMTASRVIQSPILVGRDEVLARFGQALAEAGAGRGSAFLVAGEAGIGKSRVVGALLRQAKAAGFRIAKGDLAPQDQLVPLASIRDVARSMDQADFGSLGVEVLAIERGSEGDSLAARRILVRAVADRIVAGMNRPSVLAFEDLHWADELSLEVIGELARFGRTLPLLILATYRPEELPAGSIHREWRSRLLTQRVGDEIALERLDAQGTAQMVTLILATGLPAPRDVAKAVYDRTNGIPLHIEELLAAMGGEPADGWAVRDANVPSTIEDAVLARAARLSRDAQAAARAAAVIGRSFGPDVLAGVMDRPEPELDDAIDELIAAGILVPSQSVATGYLDFRHQLLRDAIYDSVSTADLRRLHARAADFGTMLVGATDIQRSVHYERAGLRLEAYRAALAGAAAAGAVSSRFEQFELYRRAVANIPTGLTIPEQASLWTGYAIAGFSIDDIAAIELGTSTARQLYLEAGMQLEAASAILDLASARRRDLRPRSERFALLAQAEAELATLPPSTDRSTVLIQLRYLQGLFELDGVRVAEGRRHLEAALGLVDELVPDNPDREAWRLNILHLQAMADALDGRAEEALPAMLDLARQARDAGFEGPGVTNYRVTADVAARLMEYPRSLVGITEGIRYADAVQQSYCRHVMSATSALIDWAAGAWDDAVQTGELELVQRASRRGTISARAAIAFVSLGRGDIERARTLLDAALAITRQSGEIDLILPSLWGLAETSLIDGDGVRALDHCWEAAELADPTGERALLVPFVVTGVRAALLERRPDLAQRWLDRITRMVVGWPDLARPALDHAEGLVLTASGSTVAARGALESAVRGWDLRGRVWEATWARLDLAAALARGNRHAEAIPVIADVLLVARRLGSLPLLRRAEELDRSVRSRAGEQVPWHPLSAREYEVARAIAAGLTNGAIAEQLFVAPKTVSAHVEHILAKLGVARRAEIAAWVSTVARVAAPPAGIRST